MITGSNTTDGDDNFRERRWMPSPFCLRSILEQQDRHTRRLTFSFTVRPIVAFLEQSGAQLHRAVLIGKYSSTCLLEALPIRLVFTYLVAPGDLCVLLVSR